MDRFDKGMGKRVESLRLRPLRHKQGAPMMGKNFLKPFKMPQGPVKTIPLRVSKTKPVRGLSR